MPRKREISLRAILSASLLVLACGGVTPTVTGYDDTVQSWLGHDGNTLIRTWGAPAQTVPMPNGNITYIYAKSTSLDLGKPIECRPAAESRELSCWVGGAQTLTLGCTTQFEVDATQRVVFASSKGSRCLLAGAPPATSAVATAPETAAEPRVSLKAQRAEQQRERQKKREATKAH